MRGILFLAVLAMAFAACGCLMQPYNQGASGGASVSVTNATPVTQPDITAPPPRNCSGPVCGSDLKTYATDCEAADGNASVAHSGPCVLCNDSDGGINTDAAGRAESATEIRRDYCLNETDVAEYSCSGDSVTVANISCGADKECKGGECVAKPETNKTQNQTVQSGCNGPLGPNMYVRETTAFNGSVYNDTCIEYGVVKDYYCKDNKLLSENNQCPPGYGCYGGVCEKQVPVCSDDDGGDNILVRGMVTIVKGINTAFKANDDCVDEGKVLEYYCSDSETAASDEIPCPSGKKCVSGRCVKSACDETDTGMDIYAEGTVTSGSDESTDECLSDTEVREYYCYGDDIRSDDRECRSGYVCDGGECVKD